MSRYLRAAVVAQVITAAYLQLVEWVDLAPWNNVANGNRQESFDIMLLVIQACASVAFLARFLLGMLAGWVFYAVWLWLQLVGWWKPYLFGGRSVGPNWFFAHTYKFLPAIEQRPVPDANHVVLQFLIIVVLVTGAGAIWSLLRERRRIGLQAGSGA